MKRSCITILITALLITPVFAQYKPTNIEDVMAIKKRTLIILKHTANAKTIETLSGKPKDLAAYKADIQRFNADFVKIVKAFWKFNNIKELSFEELPKNATDYAILSLDEIKVRSINPLDFGARRNLLRLHICLLEDFDPTKPIYYQDILGFSTVSGALAVPQRDLIFAVQQIQNHLQARVDGKKRRTPQEEVMDNPGVLQNKTLLIDTLYMDPKLTEADIKKSLPISISNQQ